MELLSLLGDGPAWGGEEGACSAIVLEFAQVSILVGSVAKSARQ